MLLVYDVTSKSSFDNLDKWWKEIKQYCNNNNEMDKFVFVLCANKTDKKNLRVIDFSKGREWAQAHGIYFFETSTLNGDGVVEAFHMLFKCLVQVLETGHKPKSSVNDVKKQPSQSKFFFFYKKYGFSVSIVLTCAHVIGNRSMLRLCCQISLHVYDA